jgi:hypothetical protein
MQARRASLFVVGGVLLAIAAQAQVRIEGAHTQLYFPHFADGGLRAGQWQTTFTFVNVNPSTAEVNLSLFNDGGGPLSLDFGAGSSSTHSFYVPAGGIRILRGRIASQTVVTGWAFATCSVPVQATVAFRSIQDGTPRQEVTAQPTLPTLDYVSAANRFLGVAIANPYSDLPISVDLAILNADGWLASDPVRVSVPAFGHTAFNLSEKFPGLGNFEGVLTIGSVNRPLDQFVAWTLNADASGTLSALPPGPRAWPVSHWDQIWMAFKEIKDAAQRLEIVTWPVRLRILYDQEVNAYARGGDEIAVTLGFRN